MTMKTMVSLEEETRDEVVERLGERFFFSLLLLTENRKCLAVDGCEGVYGWY